MPPMRYPTKDKGAALKAVPIEVPLGENSGTALTQMAEAVGRGDYPKPLCTAQRLVAAEE